MNKLALGLGVVLALVVGYVVGVNFKSANMGGTSYDQTNLATLNVSGATSLRSVSATTLTATTLATAGNISAVKTTTTTVAVGNTGVGKLCLWNGANYSIIYFNSNTSTPTSVTSTLCQ